jgi:ubiquitin carboxyl-terminal hydrolase L3
VYGLDDETLANVPQPCVAVVILFPLSEKYNEHHAAIETMLETKPAQPKENEILFIKQTIGNACGTMAVLHAVGNNKELLGLGKARGRMCL